MFTSISEVLTTVLFYFCNGGDYPLLLPKRADGYSLIPKEASTTCILVPAKRPTSVIVANRAAFFFPICLP
ncbi:hypothetical protein BofuT4_uP006200.1 [Botrytis cinerea T4]|uniref:Uncharacterized protein n=1 Tax=Botryotinia fuckeliana (strain T4) TaxID=999810 RepID=G2Y471_BOTF4|nr:hypothetical protein BofuT4_uP006200.1 [Botrytis cinerea T4]